jgi:hypothetical protein
VYSVQCTAYSVQRTVYSVQCTAYSVTETCRKVHSIDEHASIEDGLKLIIEKDVSAVAVINKEEHVVGTLSLGYWKDDQLRETFADLGQSISHHLHNYDVSVPRSLALVCACFAELCSVR